MHHAEEVKPVGGPLLAHMDRGKKHSRNVYDHTREECGADHRNENRARGAEAAEGEGDAVAAEAGEG